MAPLEFKVVTLTLQKMVKGLPCSPEAMSSYMHQSLVHIPALQQINVKSYQ